MVSALALINRLTALTDLAVERVVVVMPLWKLQTVGKERLDFLYTASSTAGQIDLKPGVAYCLRKFYPLVADLVRGAWVRYVRRVNVELLGSATDLNALGDARPTLNCELLPSTLLRTCRGCFSSRMILW